MIINDCDNKYNNILQTKVHQAVQFICYRFPQKPTDNCCTDLDDCATGVSNVRHLLMDITNQVLHSIQINQPTRCNSFTSLLFDVYVWLTILRATLRSSSGAYNCTRGLWFYRSSVVGRGQQTTTNNAPTTTLQPPCSNHHAPTTMLQPPHSNGRTRGS
jgi:hypothetical protein